MNTIALIGNLAPRELPGSPVRVRTPEGDTLHRRFGGRYSELEGMLPAINAQFSDALGWFAHEARLTKARAGGEGLLELVFRSTPVTAATTNATVSTWERSWLDQDADIRRHPRYAITLDSTEFVLWDNEADQNRRKNQKYLDADNEEQELLGAMALELSGKILRGVESYRTCVPVITATTYHNGLPSPVTNSLPVIDTPSYVFGMTGWVYLMVDDSVLKRLTRYERRRRWIGASSWDTDLYASS